MSDYWNRFWSECGPSEANSEADLFKQVALTVNKQPIPKDTFIRMQEHIVAKLGLSREDHLLDFCCGNGLVSYELAPHVGHLTGIDFVPRNIQIALAQKSRANTTYLVGDVTAPLAGRLTADSIPNKFLMINSLAYFTPAQLDVILGHILQLEGKREFQILLMGIPNFDLKWNFYNTPERRAKHQENEEKSADINDGLGRWWRAQEIEDVCRKHGLGLLIENQPHEVSHYRMDALISSAKEVNPTGRAI